MSFITNFLKGIVVGLGGISPGLSGSVLLIILGLYQKTIGAISGIFKDFKNNVLFLIPVFSGFGVGVILFSKIVDFLLENYNFATRYAFLGLVIGTVPLFYKEVKKEGFKNYYYFWIAFAASIGVFLFSFNATLFPVVENPNLFQSVLLGVAVAGSSIVPGVDSAVILSSLGLYELYVSSLADLSFQILIPAGIGLIVGALLISAIMNLLLKRFYTITFSIIFGWFLSIIPNVLNKGCAINSITDGIIATLLIVLGFAFSYYLGDIQNNNKKLKKFFKKQTS